MSPLAPKRCCTLCGADLDSAAAASITPFHIQASRVGVTTDSSERSTTHLRGTACSDCFARLRGLKTLRHVGIGLLALAVAAVLLVALVPWLDPLLYVGGAALVGFLATIAVLVIRQSGLKAHLVRSGVIEAVLGDLDSPGGTLRFSQVTLFADLPNKLPAGQALIDLEERRPRSLRKR